MNESLTISTQKPEEITFDYEGLRKAGIAYIERTASKIWTDYNIHDPGITSLELLCYAITDLGYRSSYPVPDLLRDKDDEDADITGHFHTAGRIFPNKPLTINDYRKLLINLDGVKNAWLIKMTRSLVADIDAKKLVRIAPPNARVKPVTVRGYYDVLIEFDTKIDGFDPDEVIKQVKSELQCSRNLDEDFLTIKKVPQQTFRLCAEIELRPDASPFDVLATIFFKIQLHLAPLVRFYSLNEMLDAGFSPGKIFEGPYKIYKNDEGDANEIPHLSKGFLKDQELEDSVLKEHIRLSDLMRIILDTEGVLTIPDIIFNDIAELNELVNKWSIPVSTGHQAIVDILESNVVTLKNGVPFRPDRNEIKKRYDKLMSDYLEANENKTATDLSFDLGSYKQVDEYASIQEHFPKTYGISHWGLPEQTTVERKKQAKQLQAYCWLFDQLMANYLAQLSSFKHLLSWKNEKQTWFTKLAKDFFKAGDLFVNYTKVTDSDDNIISESWDKVEENIQLAAEQSNSESFRERRGRFLDHLLGRFAESFYDYIGILREFFPNQITSGEINTTRMNFLEKYPDYSSSRAQAFNYTRTDEIWDTENNSGFERRVQRLLGFTNINRRNLVNLLPIIREEDDNGVKKYHFEWIDKRNNILLLQGGEKFEDRQKAIDEMTIAFTMASKPDSFKIVKDNNDGKFAYELRDKLNKLVAIGRKGTKTSAEADLKSLLEQRLPVMSDEGIFLVEHLLLYNDNTTDFLPICVDANCAECSDTDPYSFRVSIVMPAYAPRFLNMEFRRYAEKVMREEMPAHLLPKICWVDNEQLSEFEEAWHAWLEVKAGIRNDPNDEVLRRFIKVLTDLKTVYPEGYLQDCSSTLEKQLFMLNKNSLGTLKTS